MDERKTFRMMNDRKLETLADIAGMNLIRTDRGRVVAVNYPGVEREDRARRNRRDAMWEEAGFGHGID